MHIEIEILLNQLAQELKPMEDGNKWFLEQSNEEQLGILRYLGFLIAQAGAVGGDARAAIAKARLKSSFTPCVLLLRAEQAEPSGGGRLRQHLARVVSLPAIEREKSFVLLINLLSVADSRRRTERCREGCSHWWHGDLSDEEVIRGIRSTYGE